MRGFTSLTETQLEGGKITPLNNLESPHGEMLLERLKSEAQAKLQLQREMVDMAQKNLESQLNADRLAFELEALRQEK